MRISPESSPTSAVPLGATWHHNNLLWNGFAVVGDADEVHSPLDGQGIQTVQVLSPDDLQALFQAPAPLAIWTETDVFAFALRLHDGLQNLKTPLGESIRLETAFSAADCEEMVEGTLEYLAGFAAYFQAIQAPLPAVLDYAANGRERKIALVPCAWGTVAVMLPQNALLLVAVVCLLNALITGNRAALRAPLSGARTTALLAQAVWNASPPSGSLSLVVAKGREFLEAANASPSPTLIHYLGASSFGGDILKAAFGSQQPALIDGTGNTWVWVGQTNDAAQVVETLTSGATRYNGQTCTSINGAVVHPALFDEVCARLKERWASLQVGALFDQKQAEFCEGRIHRSGGQILCGGNRRGNRLEPTLVQNPESDSQLVKEGVFGPVLWLRAGTESDFVGLWPSNLYPLCAAVLDQDARQGWWLARLPNLARLVVNGDPSIEHIYEPWGGYPASGANGVSFWHQKYQRIVSLDAP